MITLIKIEKISFLAIALAFLFSCEEHPDASTLLKSPQLTIWGDSPSGIDIPIQELFNQPRLVYFEDINGSKYALSEGHFVCSGDFPDAIFNKATLINLQEYEGFVEDSNGTKLFFKEGIAFRDATEEEQLTYAASGMDCHTLISHSKKPCIDKDGDEAYQRCTTVVFACLSQAFGYTYSIDENCFACGGDINGLEIIIEPLCF